MKQGIINIYLVVFEFLTAVAVKSYMNGCFMLDSCFAYSSALNMGRCVPPNSLCTFTGLHDIISHKTELIYLIGWLFNVALSVETLYKLYLVEHYRKKKLSKNSKEQNIFRWRANNNHFKIRIRIAE
jgi:hypothetical protein